MYESPIQGMVNTIIEDIVERRENAITAMVSERIGVEVDKDELKRALAYDRDQYNKGYADGYTKGLMAGKKVAMMNLADDLYRKYGGSDDTTEGDDELDT